MITDNSNLKNYTYILLTDTYNIFINVDNGSLNAPEFMKKHAPEEYKKWVDSNVADSEIYYTAFIKINNRTGEWVSIDCGENTTNNFSKLSINLENYLSNKQIEEHKFNLDDIRKLYDIITYELDASCDISCHLEYILARLKGYNKSEEDFALGK